MFYKREKQPLVRYQRAQLNNPLEPNHLRKLIEDVFDRKNSIQTATWENNQKPKIHEVQVKGILNLHSKNHVI